VALLFKAVALLPACARHALRLAQPPAHRGCRRETCSSDLLQSLPTTSVSCLAHSTHLARVQSRPRRPFHRSASSRRPPPGCAAACPHRRPPCPITACKPSQGEPLYLLHIFPGQKPRRSHRIPANPPHPLVQGPNCEVWNLSRVLSVNRGHICELLKSSRDPGAKHHLK
jgi:hypothetical protein